MHLADILQQAVELCICFVIDLDMALLLICRCCGGKSSKACWRPSAAGLGGARLAAVQALAQLLQQHQALQATSDLHLGRRPQEIPLEMQGRRRPPLVRWLTAQLFDHSVHLLWRMQLLAVEAR